MARPASLTLRVRLTPRAGRDGVDGWQTLSDGSTVLGARVRAVPEKGEANAALERLIAETLGLGRSHVSVIAGGTSRLKTLRIDTGMTEADLHATLAR